MRWRMFASGSRTSPISSSLALLLPFAFAFAGLLSLLLLLLGFGERSSITRLLSATATNASEISSSQQKQLRRNARAQRIGLQQSRKRTRMQREGLTEHRFESGLREHARNAISVVVARRIRVPTDLQARTATEMRSRDWLALQRHQQ